MRNEFIRILCKKAKDNQNIHLITADLGYGVLESFQQQFPDRFHNVGVSEQLMMGMAAGLAKEGKEVYCYSINNFASFRCLEQIRNDIAYPNLNVTIISLGAGLNYDNYGYTHYGIEDINIIATLPNIAIWCPFNKGTLEEALDSSGPKYIRLAKGDVEYKILPQNKKEKCIITYSDLYLYFVNNEKYKDYNILYINKLNSKIVEELFGNYCEIYLVEEHIRSIFFSYLEYDYCIPIENIYITDEDRVKGFSPDKRVQSDREYFLSKIDEKLL